MQSPRLRTALLLAPALLAAGCGDDGTGNPASDPDMTTPAPDLSVLPPAKAATATPLHYDVSFDLPTRVSRTAVTLQLESAGNCVTLGFRAEGPSDVTFDGVAAEAADTAVDGKKGTITACRAGHAEWAAGAKVVFAVTATVPRTTIGQSQVGFSVKNDLAGKPFSYLVSWVNGCDHHGLCDASPSRFATYKFTVTSNAGDQVLCPGTITTSGDKTTCDFTFAGGPTYSTYGIAAGRSWTKKELGSWDGVDVTLYDYPARTQIADKLDARVGADHMKWMQSLLGPFPYGKALRLVIGPTYWLGFEHPGNIVLAQTLVIGQIDAYSDPLRHVLQHEIAHQWAGDHKTLADTYDFFWKEASAEYLTFVYEDEKVGPADGKVTLDYWKTIAAASRYYPVPGEKPPLFTYYGDAYGEGPMVLFRQLEAMYGRDKVLAAVKALLSSEKPPRALSLDDFQQAFEQSTGAKLGNYFKNWMRGSGTPAWPTAKVTLTPMGGTRVRVAVDVKTADDVPRGCAFSVRLIEPGNRTFDVRVDLGPDGAPFTPVEVDPGFTVTGFVLDPKVECLVYPPGGPLKPRPPVEPWVAPQR